MYECVIGFVVMHVLIEFNFRGAKFEQDHL
jgi:hypothetical protein